MSSNTQKLRVLRARTDHDLLVLIDRELDRGFALVDVAPSRNSPLYAQVVKALSTATAMMPRISGASEEERARIERKVKELEERARLVPPYANVRAFPATFAS